MDKYYYLASQLPFLAFDRGPSINRTQFLYEAEKWLSARDMEALLKTDTDSFSCEDGCPGILKEYRDFDERLRSELAKWRKARKAKSEYSLPPDIAGVESGTPLEMEKNILSLRWMWVENREAGHHFDFDFVAAYFLKLQILERLFTFNTQAGRERFKSLCEGSLKGVKAKGKDFEFSFLNN